MLVAAASLGGMAVSDHGILETGHYAEHVRLRWELDRPLARIAATALVAVAVALAIGSGAVAINISTWKSAEIGRHTHPGPPVGCLYGIPGSYVSRRAMAWTLGWKDPGEGASGGSRPAGPGVRRRRLTGSPLLGGSASLAAGAVKR